MEKFMLFFRGSEVYEPDQSPEELQKLTEKMMHWLADLDTTGSHVASERLKRSGMQVSGRAKKVIKEPFGAAQAIVGGCTIIEAANLEAALQMAMKCPILETNASIEIREIVGL